MPDVHILPNGALWNVKRENAGIISMHSTQEEAEQTAMVTAGGEVFTHRDEGAFSRIRKGDAV